MRFLHTADWHLGKIVCGYSMLAEQAYIMEELLRLVDDSGVQAVVVAGDIYDRGVPPVEAVELLDEVLAKLLLEKKVAVLAIAGNHDSAARLNFGSRLMASSGLFLKTEVTADVKPIVLTDEFGEVSFSLLPYMEPATVRATFGAGRTFDEAAKVVVQAARQEIGRAACRSVAVAHAFIAGGSVSGSERDLSVGGADNVSPAHFRAYSYTALGHLHKPQRAGGDNIRYSGSPLKYSIDEANQLKGVTVVTIDGDGHAAAEEIPLTPRRDVRIVRGCLDEIRQDREKFPLSDDYVYVELLDEEPVLGARDKLTPVYENLLGLKRVGLKVAATSAGGDIRRGRTELELFRDFYREMTGAGLSDAQEKIVRECIEEVRRDDREAPDP